MHGHESWLPLPLVGRDDEVTAIRGALHAAANGHSGAVVISGAQGVGKTRLLDAMLAEATRRGFTIARATASRTDADVPWAIFVDAFTPIVRALDPRSLADFTQGTTSDLARVVPAFQPRGPGAPDAPSAPDDLTTRARWQFSQFLERFTARSPLALAIDNAHWTDPSSVGLLQFILNHAPHARLLILATENPAEAQDTPFSAMQRVLARREHMRQLTLAPLQPDQLLALLEAAFGVPQASLTDFGAALYQRTQGNPFFIEEMLKSLVERGVLRLVNGEWVGWTTDEFRLPSSVRDVVRSRLAALTTPARDLLDILSAFSTRVSDELLMAAAGLDAAAFAPVAEELHGRHLMSAVRAPDGILCDVTHPLIRSTVYDDAVPARQKVLHGRIVAAMEQHFGDAVEAHATELSYHCVHAGADHVAKGWRYLVLAGRDALHRHADREAAAYLQHAVELPTAREHDVTGLVEDLARARQRLHGYDAARTLWLRARDLHDARGDHAGVARAERRLGVLAVLTGEMVSALGHFARALSGARTAGRADIEVATLVSMGLALANVGRVEEAKARVQEALAVAESSGDVIQRARVERALLELYTFTGPASVAMAYGRLALGHALESGDRALAWSAHWAAAVHAGVTANADGVMEHTREAAAIARELNSPSLSAHVDEVAIEFAAAKGDWPEAMRVAERAIPVARAVAPRTLAPRILVWMGTVLLHRDELDRAEALIDEAWEKSRAGENGGARGEVHAMIVAHIGKAAWHFHVKEWAKSIEYAQAGIALGDRHGIIAWTVHRLLPILSEAAWFNGQFDLTEEAARRLRREAPLLGHRLALLYADAADAFLAHHRSPGPGTIPVLLDIAERAEAVPFVFHAARLRRFAAKIMLATGDRESAQREYRRVHETFEALGAEFELRLTRDQMREQAWRVPRRPNGSRGVLTTREREVALMAAQDRTNKEISLTLDISPGTVRRHLENVYRKMGVRSRVGLADAVKRFSVDQAATA